MDEHQVEDTNDTLNNDHVVLDYDQALLWVMMEQYPQYLEERRGGPS